MGQPIRELPIVGTCSEEISVGRGRNWGKNEEVDAAHVEDYVVPYGINFDQRPSKCR